MKVGFIGQGWIGQNYADDFEKRGYEIIRYALEEPHVKNKEKIKECDIVFVAVPTPTSPEGFDDGVLRKAIKAVGAGKTVVIKSTILPGTTESIQEENPDIFVMHSPEFLREVSAGYDAAHPDRNIIGIPKDTDEYKKRAQDVLGILPKAPYEKICNAREAELVKYGGNCLLYFKVIFINMLYDVAVAGGADWSIVSEAMSADKRLGDTHMDPVHKSGRGAGGHCFVKDFAAFAKLYEEVVGDESGEKVLKALEDKNVDLLVNSKKDLELLEGVYGKIKK